LPRSLILLAPLAIIAGLLALNQPSTAGAQPVAPAALQWSPCPDVPETQCAGLRVPIDPAQPNGRQFTLRIARVPAADPARKKGMLLFIPGGPGAGIAATVGGDNRTGQHVDEFRRDYDVVTFDPRGIGESSPIRCAPDALPTPSMPVDRAPSQQEFDALAAANGAFFKTCFAMSPLMGHLSAMDTAADIERIRQALTPNAGLVAYGGSYGTEYGGAYLERYGDHVKAMVLDAVVDHSVDLPTFIARNVLAAQDAFDRFAWWCKRDSACALHGKDLGTVFDTVVAKAPVTRSLVPQLLAAGSDPNVGWPALAQMMAQVSRGDTKGLDALTSTASLGSTSEDPQVRTGKNGLFPGVICADYGPQRDYDALVAAGAAVASQAPRFAWKYWDATPLLHGTAGVGDCVGWPTAATNPPHKLVVGLHPNVMVASPTHDPATPMINALSLWLQIPSARLLLADVDGHQSLILSKCAYEAMARFLSDPASVQTTTLCPN
jgi:pimeloyl-ACP methyl ester carboxylesterase